MKILVNMGVKIGTIFFHECLKIVKIIEIETFKRVSHLPISMIKKLRKIVQIKINVIENFNTELSLELDSCSMSII